MDLHVDPMVWYAAGGLLFAMVTLAAGAVWSMTRPCMTADADVKQRNKKKRKKKKKQQQQPQPDGERAPGDAAVFFISRSHCLIVSARPCSYDGAGHGDGRSLL